MIDSFLSYLESEQRDSPHTIEAYGRDLRQFADRYSSGSSLDWTLVSESDIRTWIGELADEGMAAATLRRKAQSLRAFYRWGRNRGLFTHNPAASLPLVKKRKELPTFVKEQDMEKLLSETPEDYRSMRTHIAITILYSLGLRQAELLGLTDADLSSDRRELRVRGKRNKERVVPVPPALASEIEAWQRLRDANAGELPHPRPLIPGRNGPLSKNALYCLVRDGLAGVATSRRSPHTLRHTFATSMLNHGADLDAVREMLGHASLQTTQIYTHLSPRELLANYRGRHPRTMPQASPEATDAGIKPRLPKSVNNDNQESN
ncbi:MAG: tyrosine-type recombinase/integrase [Muribaculaceae bacterium]|nr:tyrosine-type recombinase/integrase [Muribaculaceae bacterium]